MPARPLLAPRPAARGAVVCLLLLVACGGRPGAPSLAGAAGTAAAVASGGTRSTVSPAPAAATATAATSSRARAAAATLAVASPIRGASRTGVTAHLPDDATLDRIAAAGIGWARVDFAWALIEPQAGVFDWAPFDRIVASAEARGIALLPILGYTPPWAADGPGNASPPKVGAPWAAFVARVVDRYRGRIRAYSLWNEPNLAQFFTGSLDVYLDRVLVPGAHAVHTTDPSALVVGPELAHLKSARWDRWLDQVLRRAGGAIDVVAHHCYKSSPGEVARALDGFRFFWEDPAVRDVVDRAGAGDRPFWLTETGWQSGDVGLTGQRDKLVELLGRLDGGGFVAKTFVYDMVDVPTDSWGLLTTSGAAKPAYDGVRAYAIAHAPPPAATPSTDAGKYVAHLVQDVLGRAPLAEERAAFGASVDRGRRALVASAVVGSTEARRERVRALYRVWLGRDADPSGLASWPTRPLLEARAGLLASDEYLQRSGTTGVAFVTSLYRDVLGRAPDPSGLAAYVPLAAAGRREDVARAVLGSPERRARLVDERFRRLLGRPADPAAVAGFSAALARGLSEEGLDAAVLASDEYWRLAIR